MLIAGCGNTLLTKYQDQQCVANCSAPSNDRVYFDQPVFQTLQMFIAESLVILLVLFNKWQTKKAYGDYQEIGNNDEDNVDGAQVNGAVGKQPSSEMKGWKVVLLALPATCDIIGTTLMNVGLLLVPASIYQMIRGSIVLFVGSFSIIFLKRTLTRKQWAGLTSVSLGVFVVGLSAVGRHKETTGDAASGASAAPAVSLEAVFGVAMILLAQVFTASQFVLEEYLLEKYTMEPMLVVAWEGSFGTLITTVASAFVWAFIAKDKHGSMFNLWQGIYEVISTRTLVISSVCIMICLATFNITGLAVTRVISATSRSTIDTSRTVGIWLISLIIGWETFKFLQLVGFVMLVYGTLLFNGIIHADEETKKSAEQLLPEEFEHT